MAQESEPIPDRLFRSAPRVGTPFRTAGVWPDSTWLGHSLSNHYDATTNPWNLYTGEYRPGSHASSNSIWDFEPANHPPTGAPDSLAGWWPVRLVYSATGGLTLPDASRPWWAIDHGNVANYRLNGGSGRSRGVVGVWHADAGRLQAGGSAVTWTPLSGGRSAWCGLRQHGDASVRDATTGNPFNAAVMDAGRSRAGGSSTTARNYPGYANQWDQMLYRDIPITRDQPTGVSFRYRTRLSTLFDSSPATRTGWFNGDPLSVSAGNFISATGSIPGTPVDSFMVYVGVPVNDLACTYSDGQVRPVFDPMRRWFSEVVRAFGAGSPMVELFAVAGSVPADTNAATPQFSGTLSVSEVNALLDAQSAGASGTARLVFRVKTNSAYSDEDSGTLGYRSRGWGAVLIDDVEVNGGLIGDFEQDEQSGANSIDNSPATSALTNWKSTGKPPAVHWHPHALASLRYDDLCGAPDSRQCNLDGVVVSGGNHDDDESAGDRRFASESERLDGLLSPTIDLVTQAGIPNAMGITLEMKEVPLWYGDYYLVYDVYAGVLNNPFYGNSWYYGTQCYPARQSGNGGLCWGEITLPGVTVNFAPQSCVTDFQPLHRQGLLRGLTTGSVPDSLRLFVGKVQQCFRFGLSVCGASDGAYVDNVALLFSGYEASVDPGRLSIDIWQFWQDAFPVNESPGLPGTAGFDTTTALIKSGMNTAPGVAGAGPRFDVLGDTSIVNATLFSGRNLRLDLVFRILPGPGNYKVAGGRSFPPTSSMELLRRPTDPSVVVTPGDLSFWGQYIASPGTFGTSGGHFGGTRWDHLTWNSARCDTAERNVFPVAGKVSANVGGSALNAWASMYHELDPKFTTLGTLKNRCFLADTLLPANQFNMVCNGTIPAWLATVPPSRTGFDGQGQTREFSKILPDGLLTPGAHVEYFYRLSDLDAPLSVDLVPDTSRIVHQPGEASWDGHRWQNLSVLPDRWKSPEFGGAGMACMLVVDVGDRRGEERAFISIADSMGLTSSAKYGAHNGWHAGENFDIGSENPAGAFVHGRNQQPGTAFDLYNVKGGESATISGGFLGNRLAPPASGSLLDGRTSRAGPTSAMLRTYYRMVMLLAGDLWQATTPVVNGAGDDIALLQDFLTAAAGSARPRGLWVMGGNVVEGEAYAANAYPAHGAFLQAYLGTALVSPSFRSLVDYAGANVDLVPAAVAGASPHTWGHNTSCTIPDDVLAPDPALPEARTLLTYGGDPDLGASVWKPATPANNWVSVVDGFRLNELTVQLGGSTRTREWYVLEVLNNQFAGLNCALSQPLLDAPGTSPKRYLDAVALLGNPIRESAGVVRLTLAAPDRVQVAVYDVGGRRVRMLADRTFTSGPHELRWDGTDDTGRRLPRGAYFAQVRYLGRGFTGAKKVVLIK